MIVHKQRQIRHIKEINTDIMHDNILVTLFVYLYVVQKASNVDFLSGEFAT